MNAIEYWRELQREAAARELRLDTEREVARWRRLADRYDRNALHTSAPDFVAGVAALVQPGESVLEIGPGTGGFTLPVALRAGSVLGVDLSDAMRAALERKLAEALARRTFRPDGARVIHEYQGQVALIGWDGAAKG